MYLKEKLVYSDIMNLGIVGFGNIGQLLFENLVNIGYDKGNNIYLSNKTKSKLKHVNDISPSTCICENNVDLAKNCEVIIIAVKTPQLLGVIKEIKPYLNEEKILIHACAGIGFDEIDKIYDGPVTCIIPSIASTVVEDTEKSGVTIIYPSEKVDKNQRNFIEDLFSKFSYVETVDNQKDLKALMVTTSCMPAFIAQVVEIFSKKISEYSDLPYKDLERLLDVTVYSTVNILNTKTLNNDEIMEKVATKKGITEKGLKYLEDKLPSFSEELIDRLI